MSSLPLTPPPEILALWAPLLPAIPLQVAARERKLAWQALSSATQALEQHRATCATQFEDFLARSTPVNLSPFEKRERGKWFFGPQYAALTFAHTRDIRAAEARFAVAKQAARALGVPNMGLGWHVQESEFGSVEDEPEVAVYDLRMRHKTDYMVVAWWIERLPDVGKDYLDVNTTEPEMPRWLDEDEIAYQGMRFEDEDEVWEGAGMTAAASAMGRKLKMWKAKQKELKKEHEEIKKKMDGGGVVGEHHVKPESVHECEEEKKQQHIKEESAPEMPALEKKRKLIDDLNKHKDYNVEKMTKIKEEPLSPSDSDQSGKKRTYEDEYPDTADSSTNPTDSDLHVSKKMSYEIFIKNETSSNKCRYHFVDTDNDAEIKVEPTTPDGGVSIHICQGQVVDCEENGTKREKAHEGSRKAESEASPLMESNGTWELV